MWREPFVELRVPLLFNLRRDPYERAQHNSNTYNDWVIDRLFIGAYVNQARRWVPPGIDPRPSSSRRMEIAMLRHEVCGAFLLFGIVTSVAAQEVTLYEGENFSGRAFSTSRSLANLDATGFNDRASSIRVRSGSWQLCSDAFYRGQCVTVGPGEYPALSRMGLGNRLSSLRDIGWGDGGHGWSGSPPSGNARVTLFEGRGLQGRSITLDRTSPNFAEGTNFNDRTRSMIVESGTWEMCSDAYFRGDCRTYPPGRYDDLGGVSGQFSSGRPMGDGTGGGGWGGGGGGWGGNTRVAMYEGANFSGRSFLLTNDYMPNLDGTGFNDRASSLRVERGYWIFCSDAYFRGDCRTFAPGDYATLPPGLNNRISSGRKISDDYPYSAPANWAR